MRRRSMSRFSWNSSATPMDIDGKSSEFARKKPELVSKGMAEFTKPQYRIDILESRHARRPRRRRRCAFTGL